MEIHRYRNPCVQHKVRTNCGRPFNTVASIACNRKHGIVRPRNGRSEIEPLDIGVVWRAEHQQWIVTNAKDLFAVITGSIRLVARIDDERE